MLHNNNIHQYTYIHLQQQFSCVREFCYTRKLQLYNTIMMIQVINIQSTYIKHTSNFIIGKVVGRNIAQEVQTTLNNTYLLFVVKFLCSCIRQKTRDCICVPTACCLENIFSQFTLHTQYNKQLITTMSRKRTQYSLPSSLL